MTKPKPDYVFNVWSDGSVTGSNQSMSAEFLSAMQRGVSDYLRVSYRILVRLKNKEDKK